MSNKTTTTQSGGIGVLGLLGVVFVTLKLLGITDVATWSWWYVTMPFWGPLAALALVGLVVGAGMLLMILIERIRN